jgi:hypothetical protein
MVSLATGFFIHSTLCNAKLCLKEKLAFFRNLYRSANMVTKNEKKLLYTACLTSAHVIFNFVDL